MRLGSIERRWLALAIVLLGQLMMILDVTIVNVALPSIQRELHVAPTTLTWVINAYLITYGSFLLLAGRIGDLVGRRRVFLIGVSIFTAASATCGLSQSGAMLVASRLVQGLGSAVSASAILALIVVEFPEPRDRTKAMSAYTFVSVAGGSVGLILGGVLTQALSWHWIFFVNVPIGVFALIAGQRLLHADPGAGLSRDIDVAGSLLMTAAAMLGIFAIIQAGNHGLLSSPSVGCFAGALAIAALFLWLESRLANPIFPVAILRTRTLTASCLIRAVMVTGMYGAFFLGALYLEKVRGMDPIATGLAFLPQTVTVAACSLGITARAAARFGQRRVLTFGLITLTIGLLMLAHMGTHTAYFPWIFLAYAVLGAGAGASFLTLITLGLSEIKPQDAGLASGIVNVSVQIAGAVGLAVLGTIAANHSKHLGTSPAALVSGYRLSFEVAAVCVASGILVTGLLLRRPARRELDANADASRARGRGEREELAHRAAAAAERAAEHVGG
ncbi:MAG TPA: MFS transporter [Solirubrobacteraceae bacterium]|jgi:EmrB/QacA subfamily drug resistance transporter|nr:MFS transporter [Solirubrobacteraceae bacterium]